MKTPSTLRRWRYFVYAHFKGGTCGVLIGQRKGFANAERFADVFYRRNRQWVNYVSWKLGGPSMIGQRYSKP